MYNLISRCVHNYSKRTRLNIKMRYIYKSMFQRLSTPKFAYATIINNRFRLSAFIQYVFEINSGYTGRALKNLIRIIVKNSKGESRLDPSLKNVSIKPRKMASQVVIASSNSFPVHLLDFLKALCPKRFGRIGSLRACINELIISFPDKNNIRVNSTATRPVLYWTIYEGQGNHVNRL